MKIASGTRALDVEELGVRLLVDLLAGMGWRWQVPRHPEVPTDRSHIDGEIELRNPDTGQGCLQYVKVQVKATASGDPLSCDVALEHLACWRQSNVPVILIRPCLATRDVYWKSVDEITPGRGEKTRTVRFDPELDSLASQTANERLQELAVAGASEEGRKAIALANCRARLQEARKAHADHQFHRAAQLALRAAASAEAGGDPALQAQSLMIRARALRLALEQSGGPASDPSYAAVRASLDRAAGLGARRAQVLVEEAVLAGYRGDDQTALALATQASALSGASADDHAEALAVRLGAARRLGLPEEVRCAAYSVDQVLQNCSADVAVGLDVDCVLAGTELDELDHQRVDCCIARIAAAVGAGKLAQSWGVWHLERLARGLSQSLSNAAHGLHVLEAAVALAGASGDRIDRYRLTLALAESEITAARFHSALGHLADVLSAAAGPEGALGLAATERAHLQVAGLFARGRALAALANDRTAVGEPEATTLLAEASNALEQASALMRERWGELRGDKAEIAAAIALWEARLCLWTGRIAEALGHARAATFHVGSSRSPSAAQTAAAVRGLEGECLLLTGDVDPALRAALGAANAQEAEVPVRERARSLIAYVEGVVMPTRAWFAGEDASGIGQRVHEARLCDAVAAQTRPLAAWWDEWYGHGGGRASEILDFWGRGGFARVAAAVREMPYHAIVVGAASTDEIRRWASVFCPWFDTVVVLWKGPLCSGMTMTPVQADWGGPEAFGGHGYAVAAGDQWRPSDSDPWDRWAPALAWANILPEEVGSMLAGEGLHLVRDGRLLVCPAPLVGCTQTAVGWSDGLLTRDLLGGVPIVARGGPPGEDSGHPAPRVLDVGKVTLPYISGVRLDDLSSVLGDLGESLRPLRDVLLRAISTGALRWESWDTVALIDDEIRAAQEVARAAMTAASRHGSGSWGMCRVDGSLEARQRAAPGPGREPSTDRLRSLCEACSGQTPWAVYCRLMDMGGTLRWTNPLDNPSVPDPNPTARPALHSWLCPGDAGWLIPTVFLPEDP